MIEFFVNFDHKFCKKKKKKLATTTVKDNELIPLQQESSNSRTMYSPAPPQSTTSSPLSPPENQSSTPKIDIAATTSVPPPPTNTNPNAERVYVWDCCRSFCVSNNRLMNRIITWAIIFFNVLLFVSFKLCIICVNISNFIDF